jgi:hypothetical protein
MPRTTDPIELVADSGNPSLRDTITLEGRPMDLTGYDVFLRMRAVESDALKVDAAADVEDAVRAIVRYDWTLLDVDAMGDYRAW